VLLGDPDALAVPDDVAAGIQRVAVRPCPVAPGAVGPALAAFADPSAVAGDPAGGDLVEERRRQ